MEDLNKTKKDKAEDTPIDDTMGLKLSGHILIRDKESG